MRPQTRDAKSIFLAAVENYAAGERKGYLDEACRGDDELRKQVEALLCAHEQPNSMLDGEGLTATVDRNVSAPLGTQSDHYKLLERIGEGGMGEVYVAEQTEPVRRRVALKIIRPGMATKDVLARFEAERQALAMMDHPNIARIFDGGATEAGQPYFVMELVQGVPMIDYCDQTNLATRERLELFVTVCQAVQHAHQKGVIHRDIKPTNVLVAMQDGRPLAEKGVRNQLCKAPNGPSRQLVPDTNGTVEAVTRFRCTFCAILP